MIIGIIGSYYKENENRIPIHPCHIKLLEKYKDNILFDFGYGSKFGLTDDKLFNDGFKLNTRHNILKLANVIVLAKPTIKDLKEMKGNQVLFGWTHHVQNKDFRDLAIKKNIDLVSWEYINNDNFHLFYKNNEIAGYAGVIHALGASGKDAIYGDSEKVCILGYGSVAKGSIHALINRGYNDITVYSRRNEIDIDNKSPYVKYRKLDENTSAELYRYGIIINAILQDLKKPINLIGEYDLYKIKRNTLIVDISCDKGLMFHFATPTSFNEPIIDLGNNIKYYSVDHTPSYLYEVSTKEISKIVTWFIPELISGNYTQPLKNATNINIQI